MKNNFQAIFVDYKDYWWSNDKTSYSIVFPTLLCNYDSLIVVHVSVKFKNVIYYAFKVVKSNIKCTHFSQFKTKVYDV